MKYVYARARIPHDCAEQLLAAHGMRIGDILLTSRRSNTIGWCAHGRTDGRTNARTHGRADGWPGGVRTDGRTRGRVLPDFSGVVEEKSLPSRILRGRQMGNLTFSTFQGSLDGKPYLLDFSGVVAWEFASSSSQGSLDGKPYLLDFSGVARWETLPSQLLRGR